MLQSTYMDYAIVDYVNVKLYNTAVVFSTQ